VGGVFVAGAALLFGATVVIGKTDAVQAIPVTSMLAVRFGVAGLALAGVIVARRRSLRPAAGEWKWVVGLGGIGYASESTFFVLALGRGTAATVTLLFYTYPVMVALLSAAAGLGIPGLVLMGSLLSAVAGAGLVVGSSGGLDISTAGIGFALASALTFSLYLILADQTLRRTSSLASAMWVSVSASCALAVFSVASGNAELPGGRGLAAVASMGLLTAAAFTLLFLGLRRIGAVRTAIIASLEPVAAALLAMVFLDEALRGGVLAGGLLILAGSVAASMARGVPDPERAVP
jgi:drug/metabolite transporter (DMT)-like permease